ncbi:hypothetical protein KAW18_18405 [candidate division WOR-3 bacterium]|nr:hypothetical protein [candidate division WOR-3 bacterium]
MEPNQITTTDLADFGYREIKETIELLDMWVNYGLPEDFYEDEVRVMFNVNSGYVFLTNSEYQVVMVRSGMLEIFFTCVECGREGFVEEFKRDSDCKGCREIADKKGVEE